MIALMIALGFRVALLVKLHSPEDYTPLTRTDLHIPNAHRFALERE